MTTVHVNIGGPAQLDIDGAVRGSRWYLPLTFAGLPSGLDFSSLTAVSVELHKLGQSRAALTIEGDISQKASLVIGIKAAADVTTIPVGPYLWAMRMVADDERLNGWVPLQGTWPVVDWIPDQIR